MSNYLDMIKRIKVKISAMMDRDIMEIYRSRNWFTEDLRHPSHPQGRSFMVTTWMNARRCPRCDSDDLEMIQSVETWIECNSCGLLGEMANSGTGSIAKWNNENTGRTAPGRSQDQVTG